MIYYDSNYNIVEVSVTEKISHMYNSHYVYKTEDGRCLKKIRIYDTGPDIELEKKIQELKLKNFFTIDKYLFNENHDYIAFLMPFYKSCSDDILLKFSDYITDNFNFIFDSFDRLSKEKIEVRDATVENTIFSENKIVIIDDERYFKNVKGDTNLIKNDNYASACWILYSALINAASNHSEFSGLDFHIWFKEMELDGRELCCEISKYKYPVDYLRKIKKKIKTL